MSATNSVHHKSVAEKADAIDLAIRLPHSCHISWLTDVGAKLPLLNTATEKGNIGIGEFAVEMRSCLTPATLEDAVRSSPRMEPRQALYCLGTLGAVASSLVRHERQACGNKTSSAGITLVPGLESALLAFGTMLGRAPRDNHDTAWAEGFPISYMGTDGEARFGRAVQMANLLLGENAALLKPLCTGDLDLAESVGRLEQARENVRAYADIQADLAAHAFGAEFLAMRNFLATYRVGGQEWQAPNATNAFGWNAFELTLGTLEGFREVAVRRSTHMSRADRTAIEAAAGVPTVWERLADDLQLPNDKLWTIEPEVLAKLLETASPALLQAALAVGALLRETARMTGIHLGAINQNLVKPVAAMNEADRNKLGVAPTGGVSGTALSHTFDLVLKRRAHPLLRLSVGSGKKAP